MTTVMGLDVGGANLKAADLDGQVRSVAFPMWQQHLELADHLQSLAWVDEPDLVGVTMTAELADCFDTKADGVAWVIDSVCQAYPKSEIRIWLTSGEFADPDDAVELPQLVAAANWHALATWVGRAVPVGPAILVDTGSTTTDVIPLRDGLPVMSGLTDCERLMSGELVYTGVRRTPLCAVTPAVELNGRDVSLAAELFATTADVHVLVEAIAEDANDTNTADGRPLTKEHARARLARMLCCDRTELSDAMLQDIAQQFATAQRNQVAAAIQRVADNLATEMYAANGEEATESPQVIISGSGSFLAASAAEQAGLTRQLDLAGLGHGHAASAACSFAVARLVFERCRDELLEVVPFHDVSQ